MDRGDRHARCCDVLPLRCGGRPLLVVETHRLLPAGGCVGGKTGGLDGGTGPGLELATCGNLTLALAFRGCWLERRLEGKLLLVHCVHYSVQSIERGQ